MKRIVKIAAKAKATVPEDVNTVKSSDIVADQNASASAGSAVPTERHTTKENIEIFFKPETYQKGAPTPAPTAEVSTSEPSATVPVSPDVPEPIVPEVMPVENEKQCDEQPTEVDEQPTNVVEQPTEVKEVFEETKSDGDGEKIEEKTEQPEEDKTKNTEGEDTKKTTPDTETEENEIQLANVEITKGDVGNDEDNSKKDTKEDTTQWSSSWGSSEWNSWNSWNNWGWNSGGWGLVVGKHRSRQCGLEYPKA